MYEKIITAMKKPKLYTKSEAEFWNDAHISKQMLKAHLDPNSDGASRNLAFIDKSVEWIKTSVPPVDYPELLDIGCGPGIYAEKFTEQGYHVTGIDFSKRSVDYAKRSALQKGMRISFIHQDYLKMNIDRQFDFAAMIYCDYGALSTNDRAILMSQVYRHLRPGGKFLFDVFTTRKFKTFQEAQTWELCSENGFWCKNKCVVLKGAYQYPGNVSLELFCVVTKDKIVPYYLWTTYFTADSLMKEVQNFGFKVCGVFNNVAGEPFRRGNETIALLLEKNQTD